MDLVDYDQAAFDAIAADYRAFAEQIGIEDWVAIPVSGLNGDNIMSRSETTGWYNGPSLLEHLDTVPLDAAADAQKPLRMPVQWVNRPNQNFRGFSGQIAAGSVGPGAEVRILPSGRTTRIERIVTLDGDLDQAVAGQSVTLTFADEIDCSRGDVIAAAGDPPEVADQFEATIVWMADEELLPGRGYWMKLGTQTVTAMVQHPNTRSTSTRSSISRRDAWRLTRSASPRSRPTARSCSNPMRSRDEPEQGARRLHPHRQADQRHRCLRNAPFRASALAQHPSPAP